MELSVPRDICPTTCTARVGHEMQLQNGAARWKEKGKRLWVEIWGEGLGCWSGATLQGVPKSFPYRNRCLHAWRNPKKVVRCERCSWDTAEIEASVGLMKCIHGSCGQRGSPDLH